METAQMANKGWMDEQKWYIHTMEYYSAIKRNDFSLYMDEPWKHYAQWKNPDTKSHVLYASICMKYPE